MLSEHSKRECDSNSLKFLFSSACLREREDAVVLLDPKEKATVA
jgi:hypothetical protein